MFTKLLCIQEWVCYLIQLQERKSAGNYHDHIAVYDKYKDFYYQPYWKEEKLFFREFRLEGKDTVHLREEQVKYIVGSGQHTNSHMWESNGYLFQAPLTYYSQKGKWTFLRDLKTAIIADLIV